MAEAIREVVSEAILFSVSDPRVTGVTVLHVEVTGDLRSTTVFVSIMGEPAARENAMRGLKSATGYLQSLVAARLQTKSTPVLSFKLDDGIKRSVEMSKLIEETLAHDREALARASLPAADASDADHDREVDVDPAAEPPGSTLI